MGSTSKVCSVILRVWELVCSAVVLGLTARFVNLVIRAGGSNDARIVYTLVLASISTLYSILFMPPLMYNFMAFAADFILFVMWLVAFCLLVTRVGTRMCDADWYYNYWGWYWGGGYDRWTYGGACSNWRAILAFSFMAAISFLLSSILGAIVVTKYYRNNKAAKPGPISAPMQQNAPPGGPQSTQIHGAGAPPNQFAPPPTEPVSQV